MATAVKDTRPKERGGRFRIVMGGHLGDGPPGCECEGCLQSGGKDHLYRQRWKTDPPTYDNDIIDSPLDLERRYNSENSVKFLRLHDHEAQAVEHAAAQQRIADLEAELAALKASKAETATASPSSEAVNLDTMTVQDLRAYAAEEEIDLRNARTREDILRVIRESK